MARRGERIRRARTGVPAPAQCGVPARIAVRRVVTAKRSLTAGANIDPSRYQCAALVAQLADEWVDYARVARISSVQRYAQAVRWFAGYVDEYCRAGGISAAALRLEGDGVELAEVIYQWERSLVTRYPPGSPAPRELANKLLLLIDQRAQRDEGVPETLRRRAAGYAVVARGASKVLDEFSNPERLALRRAARADIAALEDRLERGRELLAAGRDPRAHGWGRPANLVWAARHGILTRTALCANLPTQVAHWPRAVRDLMPYDAPNRGVYLLMRQVAGLLYPGELDLHPFQVLLLLQMSNTAPEELRALALEEVEFTDGAVRIIARKARADRVRAESHPAHGAPAAGRYRDFAGDGRWDVPGLLRRMIAATALAREVFAPEPFLFTAVQLDGRGGLRARPAEFYLDGYRFTHWIAGHERADADFAISRPHDTRRLRKTAKTAKVVALGGTVSDLAGDDHHVEVFRGHYAHGTTAHVLAGRAINRAQRWVFERAERPVYLPAEAVARLAEPDTALALGLGSAQARALGGGELDMGLVNCRDPYDSPYTPGAKLCHVAPAMCMLCRNAIVFPAQLPRLVLLADHIERMRAVLDPPTWSAVWGRQAAALRELFGQEECRDLIAGAREAAEQDKARLDLPLGMRTEYDR
jgi:hypothetical protein